MRCGLCLGRYPSMLWIAHASTKCAFKLRTQRYLSNPSHIISPSLPPIILRRLSLPLSRKCRFVAAKQKNDGRYIQHFIRMSHFCLKSMTYIFNFTMLTLITSPRVMTPTSWVDLSVTTMDANLMDGQARRLPSQFECTPTKTTMLGYIISAARAATASAAPF